MIRRLLTLCLIAGTIYWLGAAVAYSVDDFETTDCAISGAGILGTLIEMPQNGADKEWRVEIERNGETLVFYGHNSDHQLARDLSPEPGDGEVFRGYHNDELVLGPDRGEGYDCGEESTTTFAETTTTTSEIVTTTTQPDDTTTTTVPDDVTTTTIPGVPVDGDCPPGMQLDPSGLACFVGSSGETG